MIWLSVNFDFFMQNLLFEKILLPPPAILWGDYPPACARRLTRRRETLRRQHRSRGYGARLFSWLKEQAAKEDCGQMHLDSGIQRKEAHRFYGREGMTMASCHFVEKIASGTGPLTKAGGSVHRCMSLNEGACLTRCYRPCQQNCQRLEGLNHD
jgi:hypothetical protein